MHRGIFGKWTRRDILRVIPVGFISSVIPSRLNLLAAQTKKTSAAAPTPFSRFVDIAASAGLTKKMVAGEPDHITYIVEQNGGGCAFFDYDNDGWMDIFILGARLLKGCQPGSSNRLYHNNRDGTFTDVTEKAGLIDCGWACGVCVGDYNNDGFEDLFLTYYGQNRLYRNNGNGTFQDVTKEAGLLYPTTRFGSGCTFVDYNRDGLLDLFVSNYVDIDLATAPKPSLDIPNCNYEGVPTLCGPAGLAAPQHFLYRNNGDGTFTDVSRESGVAAMRGSYGFTAVAFDVDEDGWQDIFVACDASPSLLLMNNRDGTFREEGLLRGVALGPSGEFLGGMGVGIGDYNLDGHIDFVKTHFLNQATGLYRNDGKAAFDDVTAAAGLGTERRFISWGTAIIDLDNDGYPDIPVVTGTVFPELERVYAKFPSSSPRIIFRNNGDGKFQELGGGAGPGISAKHQSRGAAFGDFDNDGDIDILIMNRNEPPSLLRNDVPPGNHWIKVRLEGTKSNRSALGSRVLVHYGGKVQAQSLTSQCSFLSSNDPRLHFGLGKTKTVDIEVHWPTGVGETFKGIEADQLVTIREGHGIVKGRPFR